MSKMMGKDATQVRKEQRKAPLAAGPSLHHGSDGCAFTFPTAKPVCIATLPQMIARRKLKLIILRPTGSLGDAVRLMRK